MDAAMGLTLYQWNDEGEWIHDVQQDVEEIGLRGWRLADKIRSGINQFGREDKLKISELYDALEDHIRPKIKRQTLHNLAYISGRFPPGRRNESLSVSHHVALLGVDEERTDYLLSEAEANGMSVAKLRGLAHVNGFTTFESSEMREVESAEEINDLGGYWVSPNGERIDSIEKVLSSEGFYYIPPQETDEEPPFANEGYYQESDRADRPHVAHNSGNNEWYTPQNYIEAARQVLGVIDLDPASSHKANEVVQASTYYTIEDDGLTYSWFGRVWMNPPYADKLIEQFTDKLANHYTAGDVDEAIVLVNNATETAWFEDLVSVASAVVFPRRRVRFLRPDGTMGDPLQGQAIIYMGNKPQQFKSAYQSFGWSASL